jgi:DNA-binding winged helix-turn-helix (wHTH) protein
METPTLEDWSAGMPSFRLGEWTVTTRDGFLRNGVTARRLQPLLMRLLAVLAWRAGHVVLKRDIFRSVWNAEDATNESLSVSIHQLRKALGDDPRQPRYIATVPKRGYRMLVQPELAASLPSSKPEPPVKSHIRSLAVLPLKSLSRNSGDELLAQGLTAALITELAKLRPLRVISRTSVVGYQGTTRSASEIARELDVDAILEGSLVSAYAAAGDDERSLHYLARARAERSPYLVWLLASPYVDSLRGDPRFIALLETCA